MHADADLEMALDRLQREVDRPGCLQRSRDPAGERRGAAWLPRILADLTDAGVVLVGDGRAQAAAAGNDVGEADDADWDTEFLGMKMAVGVVDSLAEAIEHVNAHGTGHSEAIVTGSDDVAAEFTEDVDAAVVYVAPRPGYRRRVRLRHGRRDQQLDPEAARARPDRPAELTTTKYVVHGDGQVRAGRGALGVLGAHSTRPTSASCWPRRRHSSSDSTGAAGALGRGAARRSTRSRGRTCGEMTRLAAAGASCSR